MISCQKQVVILTIVCLFWLAVISTEDADQYCKMGVLHQCGRNETCEQQAAGNETGLCRCLNGFVRRAGACVPVVDPAPSVVPATVSPDPSARPTHHDGSHVVLGVVIPLVLISLALGAIYAAQRFRWVQRIRAMRQRRYDEVRFGQDDDDPPLA